MNKNILVFGGGSPNKFGNMFVTEARKAGHTVINVSHKDYGTDHPDDLVLYYRNNNIKGLETISNKILEKFQTKIHLILFNQNPTAYPFTVGELRKLPSTRYYYDLIYGHIMVPHYILSVLDCRLDERSKVMFMASMMAWNYNADSAAVGYPGIKSMLAHMMKKLSKSRIKKVTYSMVHPNLGYNEPNFYETTFQPLYDHILNHDDTYNGKIINMFNEQKYDVNIIQEEIPYE